MKTVVRQLTLVFGSFVLHFLYFGIPQSFGVIYSELVSVFDVGEDEIGWIASLFPGVQRGAGIISGILVSAYGPCVTTVAGSLLLTIGMVASGFVSSPHLLYLTYGIIAGFGASLLALSANGIIISEEFTKRRTVAYGVASVGGSVGNIVLPHFTSWCIDTYGWKGCFILMGGMCLQGVIIGALFYSGQKEQLSTSEQKTESHRSLLKSLLQMLRKCCSFFNGYYFCYLAADIPGFMAYYLPYNLLYNMMITRGQTKSYSSLTLSLAGIGSIVSRVLVGFAGDYKCCHRIYYFIFSMFLCGFITLACVHLTVFWQYLLYGILYGMGTGVLALLQAVITADLVGIEQLGPAFGFLLTITAVGTSIGTPIGGWLADANGNYDSSFYFAGASFLSGGLVSAVIPVMWHCRPSGRATISGDTTKTKTNEQGIQKHQLTENGLCTHL